MLQSLGAALRLFACVLCALLLLADAGRAQKPAEQGSGAEDASDAASSAGPTIWRVSDADNTLWIFGAIHALPPGLPWRRPELDAALAEAEIVFLEIAFDPETVDAYNALALERGANPAGVGLLEQLSPSGRAALERIAASIGLTAGDLAWMKPWLALSEIEYAISFANGASIAEGVDAVIEAAANAAGKDIRSLDTVAQIVGAFADFSDAEQAVILEAALAFYEAHPTYGHALLAAWLAGDVAEMERLYALNAAAMPPIFDDALLAQRNRRWLETLDAFMAGDVDGLVVVGAFHMVGPDSLVLYLEDRGYTIERY